MRNYELILLNFDMWIRIIIILKHNFYMKLLFKIMVKKYSMLGDQIEMLKYIVKHDFKKDLKYRLSMINAKFKKGIINLAYIGLNILNLLFHLKVNEFGRSISMDDIFDYDLNKYFFQKREMIRIMTPKKEREEFSKNFEKEVEERMKKDAEKK